ncbi:hypothetical protein A6V36_17400 [Paraburkholderia ginsengiterrae]|uniref:DUF4148 domain-containing protein n=1 Tax=Paraburkholderia ginsengiterrae TaxID=1462993 RepID=A0A1A9NDU2_9BURK|nr:DUF4148 domain-containing protein [Paraburkholderia ginsengiterrae]OAJ63790.1 hypothetical protein A6V36_17400 [Paraburkholderia ginsengiterrae]OAJ65152.1 hypothetical protein A6V37_15830 [Paraburkholderia ginsengiterrae]
MKTLACLTLAACAFAGPITGFAQTASTPLTRAQVLAELLRLEAAGYNPSAGDEGDYPADIEAAQAKVAAEDAQRLAAASTGGRAQIESSQAGVSTGPVASVAP